MRRRRLLTALGAVSATSSLAGCTVHLPEPGTPELGHTVASDSFVGEGVQPTIVVTGRVTNVGPVFVERARLDCRLRDDEGEVIDERTTTLQKLEREEVQQFAFTFPVAATDVAAFERATIAISHPPHES
ncbi:MAG: FxLYD domain-containing protein [Haloferacaceae archaeon]